MLRIRKVRPTRIGPRIKFVERKLAVSFGARFQAVPGLRGFSKSENTLIQYLFINIRPNLVLFSSLGSAI